MARALDRNKSLHGVTLPRSWILENVQKFHTVQHKVVNVRVVREILTPCRDLLERVYSGSDTDTGEPNIGKLFASCSTRLDLLHQNKPLHAVPFRVRNFALARLYVLVAIGTFERSSLTLHVFPRCRTICLRELLVLRYNSTALLTMHISGVQYR
jgi:hypothetical protein